MNNKELMSLVRNLLKEGKANRLGEGIMTTPSWREANPSVDKLVNDIKKIILRQVSPANIHAMFTIIDGQPTLLINDKNSKLSSYLDLTGVRNLLDKNNMSEEELRIVFKNYG